MILFILYMVLFISQQTSEKQEILNLNQQLQQANEQLRIYAEESATPHRCRNATALRGRSTTR